MYTRGYLGSCQYAYIKKTAACVKRPVGLNMQVPLNSYSCSIGRAILMVYAYLRCPGNTFMCPSTSMAHVHS